MLVYIHTYTIIFLLKIPLSNPISLLHRLGDEKINKKINQLGWERGMVTSLSIPVVRVPCHVQKPLVPGHVSVRLIAESMDRSLRGESRVSREKHQGEQREVGIG